MLSNSTVKL